MEHATAHDAPYGEQVHLTAQLGPDQAVTSRTFAADVLAKAKLSNEQLLWLADLHWADRASVSLLTHLARRVEKVETAVEPRFQEHFVEALAFPHRTAAFPRLAGQRQLYLENALRAYASGARSRRRRRCPGQARA